MGHSTGKTASELASEKAQATQTHHAQIVEQSAALSAHTAVNGTALVSAKVTDLAKLGAFVAARRKSKKLTQQDFADLAGVGRRFVSELEGGKETAEIGKILKVLHALGVDLIVKER